MKWVTDVIDRNPTSDIPVGLDAEPVGQGDHVVRAHECMMSIAQKHQFFWETLWNLDANAELKEARKTPRVLLEGDRVTIPEKEKRLEEGATDDRHRFRLRGVPAKIRLCFRKEGEPLADIPWRVDIDGKIHEGQTDTEGRVEIIIPNGAQQGTLYLGEPKEQQAYKLDLGRLDPINSVSGVKMRLNNLGYVAGEVNNEWTALATDAVRQFQRINGLEADGDPDRKTLDALLTAHGS